MANPGHGTHFITKARQRVFKLLFIVFNVLQQFMRNNFDANIPPKVYLVSPVHFTHSTTGDKFQYYPFVV